MLGGKTMKELTIAVVGATGAVGQEILKVMAERKFLYSGYRADTSKMVEQFGLAIRPLCSFNASGLVSLLRLLQCVCRCIAATPNRFM